MHFNWVDAAIVAGLGWYAYDGYRRGLLVLTVELVGFAASLLAGLLLYVPIARLLTAALAVPFPFAKPAGFFAAWLAAEAIYTPLSELALRKLPERWRLARWNSALGFAPALLDGAMIIAVALSLAVALPLPTSFKSAVRASAVGAPIVAVAERFDASLAAVFGGAVRETLTFFTVERGSGDRVDLRFRSVSPARDEAAERRMIELVNEERRRVGTRELASDPMLATIARLHGMDMLRRGYFSHKTPEGKGPDARANDAGYSYRVFGENLAFAPDVDTAHAGLMQSPSHRENLLFADYGRIGVAVLVAEPYGTVFVQNFAD